MDISKEGSPSMSSYLLNFTTQLKKTILNCKVPCIVENLLLYQKLGYFLIYPNVYIYMYVCMAAFDFLAAELVQIILLIFSTFDFLQLHCTTTPTTCRQHVKLVPMNF